MGLQSIDTIKKDSLKNITYSSPTAQVVMTHLASRIRARPNTELHRLKVELRRAGFAIVEQDFDEMWPRLEQLGLGVVVKGRGGNSDRFLWHYDLKQVAKISLKKSDLPK